LLIELLGGCNTISAGFVKSAPGVNAHSFRECLISNSFFTARPLIGISKEHYVDRHLKAESTAQDISRQKTPDIANLPDGLFVILVGKTIREGLFPLQQYGDPRAMTAGTAGYDEPISDPSHNRPYLNNLAGGSYQAGNLLSVVPAPGEPHGLSLPVNRYLDCYVGPVGKDEPGRSVSGDYDREGRLLRAHILLTMLAAYGTELVTSVPSKRQSEDAARLLGHIRDAELALRSASLITNLDARRTAIANQLATPLAKDGTALQGTTQTAGNAADQAVLLETFSDFAGATPQLRWYGYTTRLLRVFQIGLDVYVIDARQSLDRLTNIISAFSSPTPGAFKGILNDAVQGMGRLQLVQLYGTAMRLDATETLAGHRADAKVVETLPGSSIPKRWRYDVANEAMRWGLWDAKLERACRQLAGVAKQTETDCVPKADSMKKALESELPPVATAS